MKNIIPFTLEQRLLNHLILRCRFRKRNNEINTIFVAMQG